MHGILQELLLVLVLILNVLVDLTVLLLFILNEIEKTLVNGNFELLMFISILHNLIDSILEVVDDLVVVSEDVSIRLNMLLNNTLTHSQILNHEAETRVDGIVLLQLFVHRPCSVPQARDFELLGCDILSQVSDLLIQDKFEFF